MKWKRTLKGLGIVVAALIALRVGAAFVWPTINDVRTGATPEYPDLRPQRFTQPYERVYAAALATAQAAQWDITAQDPARGEIRAVATTAVFRFKDDIEVQVSRDGEGVLVNLRSHSRIGKGDLGANARRIVRFQADLAGKL